MEVRYPEIRFIDLFAGIGGFRLGLEQADKRFRCVYTSEWLEKPRSIYRHHWGGEVDGRDIRLVRGGDLPPADLITGGFPCATFSVAGKRAGFCLDDTRGTLCFEMFRIAVERRIPYIFFENVKGLLNHDNGRTFAIILSALNEMGYDAQWELLDSQNFGVPQHRERIFLIANFRSQPFPKVFPIGKTNDENVRNRYETQEAGAGVREQDNQRAVTGTLCHRLYGGNTNNIYAEEKSIAQWRRGHFREYKSNGVPTLTANMGTGGHNVPFVAMTEKRTPEAKKIRKKMMKQGIDWCPRREKELVPREDGLMNCLTASPTKDNYLSNNKEIRKLTPIECERLQGLPDNFTKWLILDDGTKKENSDADRYERCGRTVTSTVIQAIGKRIAKAM